MPSRRQFLAAGCLALAGGAGCLADPPTAEAETASDGTGSSGDASPLRIAVADGDDELELVTADDVATVGEVESPDHLDGYVVPIELTDEGVEAFTDGLDRVGAFENPASAEIRTYFEGELVYEATLGPGLAETMETGEWNGEFLLTVPDEETARQVRAALEDA